MQSAAVCEHGCVCPAQSMLLIEGVKLSRLPHLSTQLVIRALLTLNRSMYSTIINTSL